MQNREEKRTANSYVMMMNDMRYILASGSTFETDLSLDKMMSINLLKSKMEMEDIDVNNKVEVKESNSNCYIQHSIM
ncbi:hypothetical protein SDJN02_00999 [Cucurbita argyrosperma subsp. argyrosperma]|nr:hypothetical protein SDJN02_00999 [Cucurbita argyrosperma subsp. argyrosperma]